MKIVTVNDLPHGRPINLALGTDGRVKYSYRTDPPLDDLVEALREYDSGLVATDLPYLAKGIAELVAGAAL